jgi:hypothetical protein
VAVATGALGATGGELAGAGVLAVGVEPVGVGTLVGGVGLLVGVVVVVVRPLVSGRVCAGRVATAGASRLPAEIGSEERPMC